MILYYTDKNYSYDLVNKAIFVVFGSLHCLLLLIKFLVIINANWFVNWFICESFIKNSVHTNKNNKDKSKSAILTEDNDNTEKEVIAEKEMDSNEIKEVKFSEPAITSNERIIYAIQIISINVAFIFNIIFLFTNIFYGIAITTFLIICGEMLPFVQTLDFRELFQKIFRMIDMFFFMIFINFVVYSFSNSAWTITVLSFFVFIYLIRVIIIRGTNLKLYDLVNIGFILTVYFLQVFVLCAHIKFFSLRH